MYVMYVDEAGCTGTLTTAGPSAVQPVLVIAGLILPADRIPALTAELLSLKRRFFPSRVNAAPRQLDDILVEVKGSAMRRAVAEGRANERVHAIGFLDLLLGQLEAVNARLVARVLIKGINVAVDRQAVYTRAVQALASHFQHFLAERQVGGFIIADSRTYYQNWPVSHSIFTQKFRWAGDSYDRLLELPLFGHSLNHSGLQYCDLLCSALVGPIATESYCNGIITGNHVRPGFARIKSRYTARLRAMQYRYQQADQRWVGGITVNDQLTQRSGAAFF
jgi:hypothetical protein